MTEIYIENLLISSDIATNLLLQCDITNFKDVGKSGGL